jgi:hypothetical protein
VLLGRNRAKLKNSLLRISSVNAAVAANWLIAIVAVAIAAYAIAGVFNPPTGTPWILQPYKPELVAVRINAEPGTKPAGSLLVNSGSELYRSPAPVVATKGSPPPIAPMGQPPKSTQQVGGVMEAHPGHPVPNIVPNAFGKDF